MSGFSRIGVGYCERSAVRDAMLNLKTGRSHIDSYGVRKEWTGVTEIYLCIEDQWYLFSPTRQSEPNASWRIDLLPADALPAGIEFQNEVPEKLQ